MRRTIGRVDAVAGGAGAGRWLGMALAGLTLAAVAVGMGGCNTTAGAGQDVSATGHAVTNAADKVKNGL